VVNAAGAEGDILPDDPFRPGPGQQELGNAVVREAEGGDLAVAPRLQADPRHRVGTILVFAPAFVEEWTGHSLGRAPAAHVLGNQSRAASIRCRTVVSGPPKRRASEDHWPRTIAGREIDIGRQWRAVAHRHHCAELDGRASRERASSMQPTRPGAEPQHPCHPDHTMDCNAVHSSLPALDRSARRPAIRRSYAAELVDEPRGMVEPLRYSIANRR